MRHRSGNSRGGFTLLEVMIGMVVVGLVLGNVVMMMGSSADAYDKQSSKANLELQLDQTLDRIVLALMSASRESLDPNESNPTFLTSLQFRQSLGVQDGAVVASVQERIELQVENGEVVWREKPEEPDERAVIWSRWASEFFQGELPNGVDDNGNGLIDETGLAFQIDGSRITVYLSVERVDADGERVVYSRSAVVHCRNG
jgi:prepilin-type N-terminal cleavage/methylation domain-containing protein